MNKKAVLAGLLSGSGLLRPLGRAARWSGVVAFNYHRVGDARTSPFDRGLWSATAEQFGEQVRYCKANLDMISPADLPLARRQARGRFGLITFDDGYLDNHDIAFPILAAEAVPATFFIATGFIDSPSVSWWDEIAWMVRHSPHDRIELPEWLPEPLSYDEPDREYAITMLLLAYKAIASDTTARFLTRVAEATGSGRCSGNAAEGLWMSWDAIRAMRAGGMTIGGHTVSHPILARASRERQREEILGCAARLRQELSEPMRCFSYPVGKRNAFDGTTRKLLAEAGVELAFSYYGGFRRFDQWDDYDVRRVAVESYHTRNEFRAVVSLPGVFA